MSDQPLPPCPFCNHTAYLRHENHIVRCTACGIEMNEILWSRRPAEAQLRVRVEVLSQDLATSNSLIRSYNEGAGKLGDEVRTLRAERDTLKARVTELEETNRNNVACAEEERNALKAEVERYRVLEADLCAEIVKLKAQLVSKPEYICRSTPPCGGCYECLLQQAQNGSKERELKAEVQRLTEALEWIASQSSCDCWNQPGMGSGLESKWVGCPSHRSEDPNEWCLCCEARAAIGKEES